MVARFFLAFLILSSTAQGILRFRPGLIEEALNDVLMTRFPKSPEIVPKNNFVIPESTRHKIKEVAEVMKCLVRQRKWSIQKCRGGNSQEEYKIILPPNSKGHFLAKRTASEDLY